MKIYRLYEQEDIYEYDSFADERIMITKERTIKCVDSKEKAEAFLKEIETINNAARKCIHCPIIKFSKRQYNKDNHKTVIDTYCKDKDIVFSGNKVICNNILPSDIGEYGYEEIEVE